MPNLKQSVAAGQAARAVYELAESEAAQLADPQRFWDELLTLVKSRYPQPVVEQPPAMTNAQSRVFDAYSLPYGSYAGKRVADVPLPYLCWLTDHEDAFRYHLRRYLRSDRIREEIESGA